MQATKIIFITLVISSFLAVPIWAQTVTGTVFDDHSNAELPGASVVQKDTQNGTSTALDGTFSLRLLPDADPVLVVTFVGYSEKIIAVDSFDQPLAIRLQPVTIRGSEIFVEDVRAGERAPVTQTTIRRLAIEQDNIGQDPVFTLEKLSPSVLTHSDSGSRFANYSYIRLRGMDQTRINMTLNGVPLNDMIDQGVFFSNFNDFGNSIQSVQVQRGVGTSTHGTASYAGSINFESKNIVLDEPSASVKLSGGSFNSYRVNSELNTGPIKNFGFNASFSKLGSDGYRFHSGTESTTFFISGGYFGEKDIVKVTAFNGRTKNELAFLPVPINLIREEPRTNTVSENDEDDFSQQFVQLQYGHIFSDKLSVTSSAYYGGAGGDFPVGFSGADGAFIQQIFSLENDHYGFKSTVQYNAASGLELSGGIHIYRFDRLNEEAFAPERENLFYQDKSQKDEFSSFVKANYRLGNIEFFGDLQIRVLSLEFKPDVQFLLDRGVAPDQANVPVRTWTFISPKAGITYFVNENLNLYGSFGRSGREPTRQDILGATNINPSNLEVVRDVNSVNAEYVNDFEAGFRLQTSRFAGKLNGFYMQFRDEISPTGAFIPEGFVQLRENISKSFRAGAEFEWQWRMFNPLSVSGNLTWMTTNIREFTPGDSDQVFRNRESILSPNWLMNATATYSVTDWADVTFSGRFVGESFLELTNQPEFTMPSFFTGDLGFDIRVNNTVSASLKINNVFDKRYFTHGAPLDTNFDGEFDTPGFIVQPPRHAFAEIKIKI
ncbi:MAG: TonB-dependent receptor [Balneolaceae bacterium]